MCMLLRNTHYAVRVFLRCMLRCFVFVRILSPLLPISAFPSTTTTLNIEILCTITHQTPPVTLTFSDSHGRAYLLKNGTTPPSARTSMCSSTCSLHSLGPMEEFLSGSPAAPLSTILDLLVTLIWRAKYLLYVIREIGTFFPPHGPYYFH